MKLLAQLFLGANRKRRLGGYDVNDPYVVVNEGNAYSLEFVSLINNLLGGTIARMDLIDQEKGLYVIKEGVSENDRKIIDLLMESPEEGKYILGF